MTQFSSDAGYRYKVCVCVSLYLSLSLSLSLSLHTYYELLVYTPQNRLGGPQT